jgi:hypothetical protein
MPICGFAFYFEKAIGQKLWQNRQSLTVIKDCIISRSQTVHEAKSSVKIKYEIVLQLYKN